MNKQEYIDSLLLEGVAVVSIIKEEQKDNNDKIYRIDLRHVVDNEVFYTQTRFVVVNEGMPTETAYKLKDE